MIYQFTVVFEADNFKDAVNKIPDGFEVIQSNARPQPVQQGTQGGVIRSNVQPANLPQGLQTVTITGATDKA